jgi:hypothetical protein
MTTAEAIAFYIFVTATVLFFAWVLYLAIRK